MKWWKKVDVIDMADKEEIRKKKKLKIKEMAGASGSH